MNEKKIKNYFREYKAAHEAYIKRQDMNYLKETMQQVNDSLKSKEQLEQNNNQNIKDYRKMALVLFESMTGSVPLNGQEIKFSTLDYFAIPQKELFRFKRYLMQMNYNEYLKINSSIILDRDSFTFIKSKILDFLKHEKSNPVKKSKNYDAFVRENISIVRDGQEYFLADYLDEIFTLLNEKNIPCSDINVKVAFSRIISGLPMLPFNEAKSKNKTLERKRK